ncbi:MAG: YdeI/OmpD-associated family protein [Acidobacteria bacterium]|nr:YdeI/OmpD-associated family protein [Acidobacteriota bacterium]
MSALTFFDSPAAFRRWLSKHHGEREELWVGFDRKESGRASITWPESVDEALCFGWIDGVRKKVDDESYAIRFTPRRPGSIWSRRNIDRYQKLDEEGRVEPPGREAYEARREDKSGIYSYEERPEILPSEYQSQLKRNDAAWKFYQSQPPWYRRAVNSWILSAKRDATRQRRLDQLITDSATGRRVPPLRRD